MISLVRGETYQANWTERDDDNELVSCVMNASRIDPYVVDLIGGSQDKPEPPDFLVFIDTWVMFAPRERPEIELFQKEREAFHSLPPSLKSQYQGSFVAVHNGSVVDSDTSRSALVRRFFSRFGDVSVYIGYVGETPAGYQITPFKF